MTPVAWLGKLWAVAGVLFLILSFGSCTRQDNRPQQGPFFNDSYQLQICDRILVTIFGHADMSGVHTIRESGVIWLIGSYPIKLVGQTPNRAAQSIIDYFRNGNFLINAMTVTVKVIDRNVNSKNMEHHSRCSSGDTV